MIFGILLVAPLAILTFIYRAVWVRCDRMREKLAKREKRIAELEEANEDLRKQVLRQAQAADTAAWDVETDLQIAREELERARQEIGETRKDRIRAAVVRLREIAQCAKRSFRHAISSRFPELRGAISHKTDEEMYNALADGSGLDAVSLANARYLLDRAGFSGGFAEFYSTCCRVRDVASDVIHRISQEELVNTGNDGLFEILDSALHDPRFAGADVKACRAMITAFTFLRTRFFTPQLPGSSPPRRERERISPS